MTEWLLGSLLLLILLLKLLDYLDLLDVFELVSSMVRLAGALFVGVASLIIWASRKLLGKSGGQTSAG